MITKVSILDMTPEQWLSERKKSIGGSDAGAILGLNPYQSRYSLWAEKTGKIVPEDISEKEAVRLGHDLEDYVARRFMEATGKKIRRENHFIYNSEYPFAHALPDRMVVGENAGLECKTTSSYEILKQCRAGEYPKQWYCQIMHYMMVTGAKTWYLAVLVFGHGFFWFEIQRDEDEIRALSAVEQDFWSLVEGDIPPVMDGTDATQEAVKTIFADSSPRSIDLTAVETALKTWSTLGNQIKELEELRNEAQATVQSYMADAERGECGNFRVSWKTQERKTFDRKAYEAVHGPIPPQYFKSSKSRPFKVTAI